MLKYQVSVTELGGQAQDLMDDGTMIIFDDNAPSELAEISVLHTPSTLKEPVQKEDIVTIGSMKFKVLDVGSEANHTLKQMGHCSLKFGGTKAELPGQIVLTGKMPKVQVGDQITIST